MGQAVERDRGHPTPPELQLMTGDTRFASSRLAQDPMFLMNRFGSLGSALTNGYLRELDLKVRHYSVLSLACEVESPTQRELSDFLVLDPSQVVALVDHLEKRGLVCREPDPRDRRSKIIVPTPRGREVLAQAELQAGQAAARVQSNLTDAERTTLHKLLRKLASA